MGESTDIVQKEMFTFEDMGGRSLTLRPEGTAPVCRAYVEHGMHKLAAAGEALVLGPFFRHEAPQAGRFRQFTQVGRRGARLGRPAIDAEVIVLLAELLEARGSRELRLRLSSLGTPETRARVLARSCRAFLRGRADELSRGRRERGSTPTRCARSTPSDAGTQAVMARRAEAARPPRARGRRALRRGARRCSTTAASTYEVDPTLVRGLDYYTRTVFEFTSDALGAQSRRRAAAAATTGSSSSSAGPPTPGVGWAAGIERILLAAARRAASAARREVFVARAEGGARASGLRARAAAAQAGVRRRWSRPGRSLKGQLKQADRVGARVDGDRRGGRASS